MQSCLVLCTPKERIRPNMFYKGTEWIRAGPDWKRGQVSSNGEDTPKHFLYQLDKAEGHICKNVIILLLLLYILTQSYADKVLA